MSKAKIDFEHALTLLHVIVEAGKHGPMFQKLAGAAGEELKAMIADPAAEPKSVTPPGGPANALVRDADGVLREVPPPPTGSGYPSSSSAATSHSASRLR